MTTTDGTATTPSGKGPRRGGHKNKGAWADRPSAGPGRPPFPTGNVLTSTHGARTPRVYLPLAQELSAGLLDARPDLAAYPAAVARWAEWEARALLLRRHLAEHGDLTGDGPDAEVRVGVTKWLRTCEASAERAAALLGLDPLSDARLSRERASASLLAVDLHAIAERGRQALAERDAQGLPTTAPDLAGEVLARVQSEGRATWERADDEHRAAHGYAPRVVVNTATTNGANPTDETERTTTA